MIWQPMAKAPKDGTLILACATVDALQRKRPHMQTVYWSIKDPWVSGWEVYGGGFSSLDFTHWMPLPGPPEPTPPRAA